MAAVRAAFKPEFLNRLDDIVVFDAPRPDELARIVDLQVAALAERLADRRLTLRSPPAARDWLARTGYDPVYGARPLRRLVQTAIGDPLARRCSPARSATATPSRSTSTTAAEGLRVAPERVRRGVCIDTTSRLSSHVTH